MHQPARSATSRRVCQALGLVFTVLILGACASTPSMPPPTNHMDAARQAIAGAEQSDARQFAGAELDEARQHLTRAERAVAANEMIAAERLAQEAHVAAELASARTESAKAEQINREMRRSAEALRDEMRPTGDPQ